MKKLIDSSNTPQKVFGENGDIQFNTSGSPILDLIAQGPDTFLEKSKQADVQRYVNLVRKAASEDLDFATKVARHFRDRANGQGLKEQPLLFIATLHNQLDLEQILKILAVFNEKKEGSINLKRMDLVDLVKILAWHHYIYGVKSKLSYNLCKAFATIISNHEDPIGAVLNIKNREIPYDSTNDKQVSIIDIIGIIKGFKEPKIPNDLLREYQLHLYPRHRGGRYYHIPTATQKAEEYRNYFKGNIKDKVPDGITFEKVLCTGRQKDIAYMVRNNRISNTQLKLNLQTILNIMKVDEVCEIFEERDIYFFPHELYGMAKAFYKGTKHTKISPEGQKVVESLFTKLVAKYKQECTRTVICLGDTSGSMAEPLSKKSTILQSEFSAFMSFFAAQVCSHKVFGTWDSDARLFRTTNGTIKELMSEHLYSDCSTDVVNAIKTTGKYFADNKIKAPQYICLISDMQFNQVAPVRGDSKRSNSINAAIAEYRKLTGVDLQIIYWNVNSNTTPVTADSSGALLIGGFSASNLDSVFGIVNTTSEEKELSPKDLIELIKETYAD